MMCSRILWWKGGKQEQHALQKVGGYVWPNLHEFIWLAFYVILKNILLSRCWDGNIMGEHRAVPDGSSWPSTSCCQIFPCSAGEEASMTPLGGGPQVKFTWNYDDNYLDIALQYPLYELPGHFSMYVNLDIGFLSPFLRTHTLSESCEDKISLVTVSASNLWKMSLSWNRETNTPESAIGDLHVHALLTCLNK